MPDSQTLDINTPKFNKLLTLLRELFQLDQPDLDFGIYRIMHAKADEVTQFLQRDLLPQVRDAFAGYQSADSSELKKQLEQLIAQLVEAGVDPEQAPKVQKLRAQLKGAVDIGALESDVYDHLFSFFRRYYDEGDFLAKRVYKPGVYAIPYEGEEVTLHWANKDQYYIKTDEYLRDYAFRLRPDDAANPMRVHFKLVDTAEGEHGNVKAAEGKNRVFVLASDDFIALEDGELSLRFEYRPATPGDWPEERRQQEAEKAADDKKYKVKLPAQKDLIAIATERTLAVRGRTLADWLTELGKSHIKSDGDKADYSCLEAHLRRYSARNTFDYFIHKDLGGFLRRELDFYIKNEVMHLDDIESETAPKVEQYLSKIKVIREIAGKIIDFLAQLENFQKKLWLKKKFVVETSWCITLGQIPDEFYPEIAANQAQYREWVELFAIDELDGAEALLKAEDDVDDACEFLKGQSTLVVDARHFDVGFISRLLESLPNLDTSTNGVLMHSENFQAIALIGARYRDQVKCVYIDPPYNTASSSIPYKNDYKHSSFATLMNDRVASLHSVLSSDGAMFVSIDKAERSVVEYVMDENFGARNRVEELIWSMNTNNSQAPNYSTNHEYVLVYAKNRAVVEQDRAMFREPKPGYIEVMDLIAQMEPTYPPITEVEEALLALYKRHVISYREEVEAEGLEWDDEKSNDPWKGLFNYSNAEYRQEDGQWVPEDQAKSKNAHIWVWQEGDASMPATKQSSSVTDKQHKNWRFYKPKHPVTGKPSPHPKSGWKFAFKDDEDSPGKRSFVSLDLDHRIGWGPNEHKVPRLKRMLHEVETNVGKSVFSDYSDGEKQTSAMFGRSGIFLAPKHSTFVSRFIQHAAKQDSTIFDCFGGSGSTAHAVIELNREDRGSRKYVTVEMGNHFDTVLKPRTLKAVYSCNWRAGKPLSRKGSSQLIKILRLESYEDTLNNLAIQRTGQQDLALEDPASQGPGKFKEQYLLRYQLDVESKGSQSLLNIAAFTDPTAYKLLVKTPGSDESREVNVDLLETFNYLIGLTVQHMAAPRRFAAEFERDSERRLQLKGRLKQIKSGPHPDPLPQAGEGEKRWWFRTVTGTTPEGHKALVIWRKLTGDAEQDNLVLDTWFKDKQAYSVRDTEFDLIWVNGDSTLENLRLPDETWKVRLIEEDFQRLMFDSTEV